MAETEGYEMTWGDAVDPVKEFRTIPEGDYPFEIDHYDRARSGGGKKIPPCNMAVVYFNIKLPDGDEVQIRENFMLWSTLQWKIAQLFTSVGLQEKGQEGYVPEWDKLPGMTGVAKVSLDADQNDPERMYNHIKKMYPKGEGEAAKPTPAAFTPAKFTPGVF